MKSEPYVSVIIPVHNRPRELKRAVASVLAQTYSNFEIIIVDDCSTDNTFDVIRELQAQDLRIKGFRNEKNGGGAHTRNQGVLHSRGELIAFLDSDDEWSPEKLEKQLSLLDRVGDNSIIVTYFKVVGGGYDAGDYGKGRIITGRIREQLLKGHCGARTSTILVRREYFDRVGGFSDDLQSMQEYDLWIKLAEFYSVECVPEFLVVLHTDADVRISINPAHRLTGIEMFYEKWADTIEREVGREYVKRLKDAHQGTAYFNAVRAALKAKDVRQYLKYRTMLLDLDDVSWKRKLFLMATYVFVKTQSFLVGCKKKGME